MWKRHPELAVFVNDNGTVTSERRYMAAINEDRRRDGLAPISAATVIQTGMQPIETEPKLLKPFLNRQRKGYLFIKTAEGQTRALHKIVAEVYIPNPKNKPQVNHKDGDKSHCYAANLEWTTRKENAEHAVAHGLYSRACCKKIDCIDRFGNVIATYGSLRDAADILGIRRQRITDVLTGRRPSTHGYTFAYHVDNANT